ncbi:hypothetical protein ACLI1A_09865 [Flavobacterium sp. RHBU_3]|uniref:hypothetical protein n=1 Tax=Flavobacterium sp. RHBU_3 TaxID=3391184 RepID=UPI003984A396
MVTKPKIICAISFANFFLNVETTIPTTVKKIKTDENGAGLPGWRTSCALPIVSLITNWSIHRLIFQTSSVKDISAMNKGKISNKSALFCAFLCSRYKAALKLNKAIIVFNFMDTKPTPNVVSISLFSKSPIAQTTPEKNEIIVKEIPNFLQNILKAVLINRSN